MKLSNEKYEQSLLVAAILKARELPDICRLDDEDFSDEKNRIIFKAVKALHLAGTPLDLLVLKSYLEAENKYQLIGGDSFLVPFFKMYAPENVKHLITKITTLSKKRKLRQLSCEIIDGVNNAAMDSMSIVNLINSQVNDLISADVDSEVITIEQSLPQTAGELKREKWITTGISKLDNKIFGIFYPAYIVLAARPSIGKTTLALQVARRARTLFISLETRAYILALRILVSKTGIDMNRIRAGNITDTEAERLTREIAIIKQDYSQVIMIDRCYHIDSIITAIRRAVIKFGIEVVIIDHIGLIEGGRGESRNIQLADISRRLAQEKNTQDIIILALSQMNREIEKRAAQRPILADLRDSGSLEQDADMVWFMHRKERAEAETLFDIAKNRDGVTGDFNLYFDASRLTFNSENLSFDNLQTFGGI